LSIRDGYMKIQLFYKNKISTHDLLVDSGLNMYDVNLKNPVMNLNTVWYLVGSSKRPDHFFAISQQQEHAFYTLPTRVSPDEIKQRLPPQQQPIPNSTSAHTRFFADHHNIYLIRQDAISFHSNISFPLMSIHCNTITLWWNRL
jgi:hypothetical protein